MSVPAGFLEDLAEKTYEDARCGLSHDAMTRHRIMLSYRSKLPIGVSVHKVTGEMSAIVINPKKWVDDVDAHLTEFVIQLRDPKSSDARKKFTDLFTLKHPPGRLVGLPPEALNFFE